MKVVILPVLEHVAVTRFLQDNEQSERRTLRFGWMSQR
jgi:hypothetical protein